MAFELDSVVPWGRTMEEYFSMFNLNDIDISIRIAGFGDGPASFNCEATKAGLDVVSFDPLYQFSNLAIEKRINEVRTIVMDQMAANVDNFVWTSIKSLEELENVRMGAMNQFLEDYELGLKEGRYICHELPNRLSSDDDSFDLGLSSHFLLLYSELGFDFHIQAINEMLRVCKEVRIFPLVDLDAKQSQLISDVVTYYQKLYLVEIQQAEYEFQKGANRLLVIKK